MVVDCWSGDLSGLRRNIADTIGIDNGSTTPVANRHRHSATDPDRLTNLGAVARADRTHLHCKGSDDAFRDVRCRRRIRG